MLKRTHYLALAGVLLLTLGLLNLPATVQMRVKSLLGASFLPLFGIRAASDGLLDRAGYQALPRSTLIDNLLRLERENAELRVSALQGADAMAENQRLRAAIGAAPRGPWRLRLARDVGRDPTTWWRTLQINLGSRDNLKADQVVMSGSGLVGRVSQAALTHSQVALVGDAECGVAVVVKETRDLGIIKPGQTLSGDGGLVEMTLLQNCPGIMAGQTVLTSGLGGVFPAGLPVGTIVDTRNEGGNVFTTARIRLSADLNRLEEVWVLQP